MRDDRATPSRTRHVRGRTAAAFVLAAWTFASAAALAADGAASGSLRYKSANATLKYAYLVKGPDAMDPKQIVRQVILSSTDIGAKLRACANFSCASGAVTEGMTVDFDAGPRLNYWVAVNDQRVQYSGTAKPATFAARVDEPGRLAGKLAIDDSAAGGARVDVEFEATLLKEFKAAR